MYTRGTFYHGVAMTDRPEAPKSAKGRHNGKDPSRVAVISLHTSPRDQPGSGDSGGMNVYVLSVARRLGWQGKGE